MRSPTKFFCTQGYSTCTCTSEESVRVGNAAPHTVYESAAAPAINYSRVVAVTLTSYLAFFARVEWPPGLSDGVPFKAGRWIRRKSPVTPYIALPSRAFAERDLPSASPLLVASLYGAASRHARAVQVLSKIVSYWWLPFSSGRERGKEGGSANTHTHTHTYTHTHTREQHSSLLQPAINSVWINP